MALRTPPSYLQNGSHPAEQDRLTTQGLFRTSGVLLASDLQVTQSSVPAMSVQIAAGWGNIIGTTQSNMGAYQFYNDAAATATITTADVTNPRIDLICITVRDAYYTGTNNDVIINVVAGTPAGSPAVPATPANSLVLAQVAVAANATTIVNANITDLRQVVAPVNVAQSVAGKNAVINGSMDIWQRGTSVAIPASQAYTLNYSADRWDLSSTVASQAMTISRQATGDTTNLPNIQYCARVQRNAAQTGVTSLIFTQSLESINAIPFAGKQVTLSYYARAGANYSATSNTLTAQLYTGTGTDQNMNIGYSGSLTPISSGVTLTTTWQRFSASATLASSLTEIGIAFQFIPTGTAGANDYFEITGIQLELGSTATTFSRAGGSIGGELQLCRRYLPATYVDEIMGYSYGANNAVYGVQFDVPARVAPTNLTVSGTFTAYALNVGSSVTPAFNHSTVNNADVLVTSGLTITAGQGSRMGGGGLILWTGCEL